jgi:hypothetical protein
MNIFVLHEDPRIAAEMHCDKHAVKMIIEHTQMMATAYYSTLGILRKKEILERQDDVKTLFQGWPRKHEDGSDWPYSVTHINHPCTIWTRESIENFNWMWECNNHLCDVYQYRWGRQHSIKAIMQWMKDNPPNLLSKGQTPFAMAFPDCYKEFGPIEGYRKYYAMKTTYMKLQWRYSETPEWWTEDFIRESVQMYRESQLLDVA